MAIAVSEHTTKAFDADLLDLTRMISEMGGYAERSGRSHSHSGGRERLSGLFSLCWVQTLTRCGAAGVGTSGTRLGVAIM